MPSWSCRTVGSFGNWPNAGNNWTRSSKKETSDMVHTGRTVIRQMPYETILDLNPSQAPEGDYFNSGTPDRDRESRWFPGWYNEMTPWGYRNQLSLLRVARDEVVGANVLEWADMAVRYLLTTDPYWSDLHLWAKLRLPVAHCNPYHDIPECTQSRLGIVFRYEDHRHYYFFAMEGLRRLVVYRRDNDQWDVIADQPVEHRPVAILRPRGRNDRQRLCLYLRGRSFENDGQPVSPGTGRHPWQRVGHDRRGRRTYDPRTDAIPRSTARRR